VSSLVIIPGDEDVLNQQPQYSLAVLRGTYRDVAAGYSAIPLVRELEAGVRVGGQGRRPALERVAAGQGLAPQRVRADDQRTA
jgi:hypothetical protein